TGFFAAQKSASQIFAPLRMTLMRLQQNWKNRVLYLMKKFQFVFFILFLSSKIFASPDSVKVVESMNFAVTDVNGDETNFKNFLGHGPLLVNFWALWCEPCKQEMKAFIGLADKLKEKGVSMVSINTDKV